jgi:hypothetical protein
MELKNEIIEQLSPKGILAYVAASMAEHGDHTTAALASLVRCQTAVMREGMNELVVAIPELVRKNGRLWWVGCVEAGAGMVQLRNPEIERYRLLVDDLKKYWDFLNPNMPFSMSGKDGVQIGRFLREHRDWGQMDWRVALNNRKTSVMRYRAAPKTSAIWVWIARLGDYSAGPLNAYGKPPGGGKDEHNREALARAIADAR